MDNSLYKYVIRYSLRNQIWLMVLAGVSFPFLYLFYELPKNIVNGAIQGRAGPFPVEYFGVSLDQVTYLFILTGLFLLLVVINQMVKYYINVFQGITGERMLRRLRFQLYSHILRFPLPQFRKISPGELIAMLTGEVEPLGGFVGDSFAIPAFQGGTLLVILTFLFIQNPMMAAAAVALYPVQMYFIPRMQRRVNQLGKERVRLVRRLSERIGETVQSVQEIHANDTSAFEQAQFSSRLGAVFWVRFDIYNRKFMIKFLNNFIQQMGPFFFYAIGGYFVIKGSLDLGTLVAAVAAHKDLASPWKELLTFYQAQQDARIKYEQIISQFVVPGLMEEKMQQEAPDPLPHLAGKLAAANLTLANEDGINLVDSASFTLDLGRHTAVVGASGSGKEELGLLLARLLPATGGRLSVDGLDLRDQPEALIGRRIGFVGPGAALFAASLRENLTYGLKHRPLTDPGRDLESKQAHARELHEATSSGNSAGDLAADWIDYRLAGINGPAELNLAMLMALEVADMTEDVYQYGLRGTVDPGARPEVAERVLRARMALRERVRVPDLAGLVEFFDDTRYNTNATVAENLMFGTPVGGAFDLERLAASPYVTRVLDKIGLTQDLLVMGRQIAATMVELFADLPPDHEFFRQFSFISADSLPDFQALLAKYPQDRLGDLKPEERLALLSLPFKLIPTRHRLDLIDAPFQARILAARTVFASDLPVELKAAVEFFDVGRYNAAATLQDNILFGKIAYGQAEGSERIGRVLSEVIASESLRETIVNVGLDFQAGIGGSRLSGAQRQKLSIARNVLKRPDVLIISEGTAALDAGSQTRILERIRKNFAERGLIWVLHRVTLARDFDHILVMQGGHVVEQGNFEALKEPGTVFQQMLGTE
ncbi:MAG: ABC transporter ATP-binding protein [Alphaproteobacteria bacterium]|nr:ABC transporter ATP-binding protein [Alphaproteobacteria bacterium]